MNDQSAQNVSFPLYGCSTKTCNGVMELVARNQTLSLIGFERVHRTQEDSLLDSDKSMVLLYKCSCCQRLDFRVNDALNTMLNDRSMVFPLSSNTLQGEIKT
jgi:hypothetical protein